MAARIHRSAQQRPPPPARTGRLTREQRRSHFLDMAAEIITDHGAESVTMEGVAARAGVSKALGYRYFTNRDDLLVALFDREIAVLDQRIIAAVVTADDLEGRLRAIVNAWLQLIAERGKLLGSLQQSKLIEGPVERRRLARQRNIDEFFAALIEDEYDMSHDDAVLVAAMMLAASQGALRIWSAQEWSPAEMSEQFVRFGLGGIAAMADGLATPAAPHAVR